MSLLKPEWKTKWVEALRSGKYIQGRKALRKGHSFCCLGVLCDITGAGGWREDLSGLTFIVDGYVPGKDSSADFVGRGNLPMATRTLVLANDSPETRRQLWHAQNDLIDMNDGMRTRRMTFAQIADYIEEKL